MEAKLVYLVDDQVIELESMDFEKLDQMTYSEFKTEQDIFSVEKYQEKLGDLPQTGEFKISFDGFGTSVIEGDYLAALGFDPFARENYMSVLVGNNEVGPNVDSVRKNIVKNLSDINVIQSVYDKLSDVCSPYEKFMYATGMLYEDSKLVYTGFRGIINGAFNFEDGYFVGRAFLEGLKNMNEQRTNVGTDKKEVFEFIKK